MTNTVIWGLQSPPLVVSSLDGLTNVITAVHWCVTAISDQKSDVAPQDFLPPVYYWAYRYNGPLQLGAPNPASFTPFEQVTLAMVNGWVQDALGADQVAALQSGMYAEIEAKIAADANPSTSVPTPLTAS